MPEKLNKINHKDKNFDQRSATREKEYMFWFKTLHSVRWPFSNKYATSGRVDARHCRTTLAKQLHTPKNKNKSRVFRGEKLHILHAWQICQYVLIDQVEKEFTRKSTKIMLLTRRNMVNNYLFPQFKSPQGGNPGLSQLKSFTNSSYGKRI